MEDAGDSIMTKIVFPDFDEFADAINGIDGRFVPTALSEAQWWVQVVPVGGIAIQQVQIGGASTFAGDGIGNSITLGIPVTSPRRIRIDGDPLGDNAFILVKEGQPFTFAARQTTRWAGITVPVDHPSLTPEFLDSLSCRPAHGRTRTQTDLPHVSRARLLVSRLCRADDDGAVLEPAATRSVEEEVFALAAYALKANRLWTDARMGRPRVARSRVIANVLSAIEASAGQPLLMRDLRDATRVSERTLRNVFREYFGVGPMRLLKVRQLHEIRRTLMGAEANEHTVAGIAGALGVWDLSGFTRNYKALYGEAPSKTLHSPSAKHNRNGAMSMSWIRYAARKFQDGNDEEELQ